MQMRAAGVQHMGILDNKNKKINKIKYKN